MKRLGLAVGLPLCFLAAAEGVLRFCGMTEPASFLVVSADGRGFVPNEQFGRAYHCPESPVPFYLPAQKPADAAWVFLLGESAAQGAPDPAFGPARVLETLLAERFPGKQVEVFNAAIMGVNSFAVADIARECASHGADLLVVYAGNNEQIGSFGVHHFANRLPPAWARRLIRGAITARASALGQAVLRVGAADRTLEEQDEAFFLAHRIPPDDPRREKVRDHFAANLEAISRLSAGGGPAVLLSTVAVNLRDWPPLASLGTNETDALSVYLSARSSAERGDAEGAARAYARACRLDALPFRVDPDFNETIRATAARTGTRLVDTASAMERDGATGDRMFMDHVHFRFAGSCALARILLSPASELLANRLRTSPRPSAPATDGILSRRLAYTTWDELKLGEVMLKVLSRPPCSLQHEADVRLSRERLRQLDRRAHFDPAAQRACVARYEDANSQRPRDVMLQASFAELLEALGIDATARDLVDAALARHPQHASYRRMSAHLAAKLEKAGRGMTLGQYHFGAGTALLTSGEPAEAAAEFKRAIAAGEQTAQVWNNLGAALLRTGAADEAIAAFERVLRLQPDHAGAHLNLGLAMNGRGDTGRAIAHLRRAVELGAPTQQAAIRLALLLSTSEQAHHRNGTEALALAQSACAATKRSDPQALAALVAASAECGLFEAARSAWEEQRALLERRGARLNPEEVRQIEDDLRHERPIRAAGVPTRQRDGSTHGAPNNQGTP